MSYNIIICCYEIVYDRMSYLLNTRIGTRNRFKLFSFNILFFATQMPNIVSRTCRRFIINYNIYRVGAVNRAILKQNTEFELMFKRRYIGSGLSGGTAFPFFS